MTNLERLTQAFRTILGIDDLDTIRNAAYRTTMGWDSVAHMRLVGEIENTFHIMLETDDVIGMSSFEKAAEIVARYGVDVAV